MQSLVGRGVLAGVKDPDSGVYLSELVLLMAGTVAAVWQVSIGNVDAGSPFATLQSTTITGGWRPIDCGWYCRIGGGDGY